MADHPEPNPALQVACELLGGTFDEESQSCIMPGALPGVPTTIPGGPTTTAPGGASLPTTTLPTGHILITEDELDKLEADRDSLKRQRIYTGIAGTVLGMLVGAGIGYAAAR